MTHTKRDAAQNALLSPPAPSGAILSPAPVLSPAPTADTPQGRVSTRMAKVGRKHAIERLYGKAKSRGRGRGRAKGKPNRGAYGLIDAVAIFRTRIQVLVRVKRNDEVAAELSYLRDMIKMMIAARIAARRGAL